MALHNGPGLLSPAKRTAKPCHPAAAVKEKIDVVALAKARGFDPRPSRNGRVCDCPHCGNRGAATIRTDAKGYRCEICGASGDVLTFEMAATGADFVSACVALERRIAEIAAGDDETPSLFAADQVQGGRL